MTEREILRDLKPTMKRHGFWFKMPDVDTKHSAPKPFDVFFIRNGRTMVLEAKRHTMDEGAWPLSSIEKHQWDGLGDAMAAGADGAVLLFVVEEHTKPLSVTGYWLLVGDLSAASDNVKSLKLDAIQAMAFATIRRIGKDRWDVSQILKWMDS